MSAHSPRRPEVIGHGGAGADHTPNSEAAIRAALASGVDRIELDVLASGDGVLVLAHDATIAIGSGRRRAVDSLSLAELRAHEPELLTLDEAATLVGGRVPLLLDAKRAGYEDLLSAAISDHGWTGTATVSSTYALSLWRLRRRFPGLRLGLATGHWAGSTPTAPLRAAVTAALRLLAPMPLLAAMKSIGATDTMLHHQVATAPLVADFQRRGYRVNLWTVDHPGAIERANAFGADGIISNRPDLVRRLVDHRTA